MNRLFFPALTAAIALSTFGATAALAQPYQPGPPGRPGGPPAYQHGEPPAYQHAGPPGYQHAGPAGYAHPGPPGHGPGWHQWHRGDRYNGNRYYVNNWHHYGLRPPPPGYRWVQNGSQFVLIGVTSGIIADIILNTR